MCVCICVYVCVCEREKPVMWCSLFYTCCSRFMMTHRNQKSQSSIRETASKPAHRRHKHHTYHHRPFQPFSVSVGPRGTQLTIKSGDITLETVCFYFHFKL